MDDEALALLGIQDAALCQVWLSNGGADKEPLEGIEKLPGRLERWLSASDHAKPNSEGRRSQTLLRELIDRLERDEVDKMSRDELDLLEAVHGFAHAAQNPVTFERVRRAIAPRRARIAARRAGMPAVVGTPALSARFLVIRAQDILAAQAREVRVIAGVELPSRGPVMVHSGHVRVLGDVPQNTTLVVEDGACVVDGFVIGRVAVSGTCEVLENISGVVISRNGDVRARNIVDGSMIVAKRGWVHCRRAAGTKLVFAGNTIKVSERASRCRFLAPTIKVAECIEAGEMHSSLRVESAMFRSLPDATLDIVFRRSLSCKDYGENPGKQMTIDVTRALRTRAELQCARQQLQLVLKEAEDAAETALTYILAGDAAGQMAGDVLSAQRRLDVLNRVLLGLRALYAEAEAKIDGTGEEEEAAAEPDFFDRLDGEMKQIISEQPNDATLTESYDQVAESRKRLRGVRGNRKLMSSALADIGEKLQHWRQEFIALEETIRLGRENIRKSIEAKELIEEAQGRSRVLTLQRLLKKAGERGASERLKKRIDTPFVTLMTRTIEKRLMAAKKYKDESDRLQKDFDAARDVVWKQYQMRIEAGDSAGHRITVEGCFENKAKFYTDPAYITMPNEEVPRGGTRLITSSGGNPTRYVCIGSMIAEEPFEQAEEAELAKV